MGYEVLQSEQPGLEMAQKDRASWHSQTISPHLPRMQEWLREQQRRLASRLAMGLISPQSRYALRRDLELQFTPRPARTPIAVRPLRAEDLDLLMPQDDPSRTLDEQQEIAWRRSFAETVGSGGFARSLVRCALCPHLRWNGRCPFAERRPEGRIRSAPGSAPPYAWGTDRSTSVYTERAALVTHRSDIPSAMSNRIGARLSEQRPSHLVTKLRSSSAAISVSSMNCSHRMWRRRASAKPVTSCRSACSLGELVPPSSRFKACKTRLQA